MGFRFFVPDIGTEITLAEDWEFVLYPENRNEKLWLAAGLPLVRSGQGSYIWGKFVDTDSDISVRADRETAKLYLHDDSSGMEFEPLVKLPKGTVLRVARIYIRAGKGWDGKSRSNYSSLTFTIKKCPDKKLKGRFWAKLADVNQMVLEDPHV